MASYLIDTHGFERARHELELYSEGAIDLLLAEQEVLTLDWLGERFSPEYYVFLSRHRSESEIPALTCHTTGNFSGSSEMGGRPRELAYTYPSLQKHYMRTLWEEKSKVPEYQMVIEATHHGPTALSRPILFVEIGSGEKQWRDKNAIAVVSEAVLKTVGTLKRYDSVGIGLGGTHYPSKFNELLIGSEHALAAVASKHSLPHVDRPMLEQMVKKSVEDVKYAFLDWKGLGKEKERLSNLIRELGLEVIKL